MSSEPDAETVEIDGYVEILSSFAVDRTIGLRHHG